MSGRPDAGFHRKCMGEGLGHLGPSEWKNEMLGFGVIIYPIADIV